ncbi:MAG: hypothetical protein J6W29_03670 [Neisseriaceae bacterium]|nr:hypothetical protein [Neisseriaceae bacterium]
MKRTFSVIALVLAFSLTACSKEEVTKNYYNIKQKIERKDGRAIIVPPPVAPQPPEFPKDAEIQAKIAENLAYINSKIVEKDGKTTYYFVEQKDKDGKNTYLLTDDKSKADYYRVILGTTADGYCAVQDFHANGNKQIEPLIERDIQFCNRFDGSDKPQDSLVKVFYDKEEKIESVTYFDIKNKQRFVFAYDENGNKLGLEIVNLSNIPKLTEFHFHSKSKKDGKYKSFIRIFEFNEENLIKFTGFFYHNSNLKNIDNIMQYDFSANEKKEIVWLPQNTGNVAVYLDNDPEYEKKTQEFFEKRKKWIKEIKEEFNFRLSQNSNNK